MVRVTNGLQRQRNHKKFIRLAKGFRLGRKNVYKQVRLALIKQGVNAYIGRKLKKRDFRKLWIERLSAAIRMRGGKYSVFMNNMKQKGIILNRKILSNVSIVFPEVFSKMNGVVMGDAPVAKSKTTSNLEVKSATTIATQDKPAKAGKATKGASAKSKTTTKKATAKTAAAKVSTKKSTTKSSSKSSTTKTSGAKKSSTAAKKPATKKTTSSQKKTTTKKTDTKTKGKTKK